MNWRTKITEMLGIRYPIIHGAFDSFGTADFAIPSLKPVEWE